MRRVERDWSTIVGNCLESQSQESDSLQIERKEEVAVTTKLVRLYVSLALN